MTKTKNALLLANARFYEAFEQFDIEALDSLWQRSENVRCIHPGSGVIEGWSEVRRSWESIFSGKVALRISLRNVKAEIHNTAAIVTLVEEIVLRGGNNVRTASVAATNIFDFDNEEWKMIHHHGSVLTPAEDDLLYRYN
ncbi:MAG: nuclear transport factor 2 family protein [Bacteroidota bacterium]